jgi:dynein heavy chain
MLKNGLQGVKDNLKMLDAQLLETVALVRQRLNRLQSMTLGALIVIDVHAKDVVAKLVTEKV